MTGPEPVAVVLVSGGMDSCVTAAIAGLSHRLALMHARYGQRSELQEMQAFNDIADHYGVDENHRLRIELGHLADIGGSALTDPNIDIPPADLEAAAIPVTYVPFRNGNLLSAAASWAETLSAEAIFIGAVEEDSSGYPDCRQEFFDAFEQLLRQGMRPETRLEIRTPLIHMTKKEIVLKGIKLGAPLELTWSCYQDAPAPCGTCDSCALRARGFSEAGVQDPLMKLSAH